MTRSPIHSHNRSLWNCYLQLRVLPLPLAQKLFPPHNCRHAFSKQVWQIQHISSNTPWFSSHCKITSVLHPLKSLQPSQPLFLPFTHRDWPLRSDPTTLPSPASISATTDPSSQADTTRNKTFRNSRISICFQKELLKILPPKILQKFHFKIMTANSRFPQKMTVANSETLGFGSWTTSQDPVAPRQLSVCAQHAIWSGGSPPIRWGIY